MSLPHAVVHGALLIGVGPLLQNWIGVALQSRQLSGAAAARTQLQLHILIALSAQAAAGAGGGCARGGGEGQCWWWRLRIVWRVPMAEQRSSIGRPHVAWRCGQRPLPIVLIRLSWAVAGAEQPAEVDDHAWTIE